MSRTGQREERAEQLLKTLVESYIREGHPIGSKTLVAESALSVSPATVRNIMAELEEKGYVTSPHTSAGRIPTERGYRLYVDALLKASLGRTGRNELERTVQEQLGGEKSRIQLVETASRLLSDITRMTGLVVAPKREASVLHQVEFLPLSGNRILVILVMDHQEVENRVIQSDREYRKEELKAAANYINQYFAGRTVEQMRFDLLQRMQEDKDRLDELMQTALDVTSKAFTGNEESEGDVVVSGEGNLLTLAESGGGVDRIRELFDAFGKKRDILHLLDNCVNADGVQIFIGEETGYSLFDDCSLITAPYKNEEQTVGVLAVLGPTRMNYEQVITTVDITSKILSSALKRPE